MKKKIVALALIVSLLLYPTKVDAIEQDTYLSEEIQFYCYEAGELYGICPETLMAMNEIESSGNPNVINGYCIGLMQINYKYHWERAEKFSGHEEVTIATFFSPDLNIFIGADYLAELLAEYGDMAYALDFYNGNSKATYNYENGIMSEYATKVLERSAELERLHGK